MTLKEIREEIDQIDQEMKALFIKRMDCAKYVAETKAESGDDVFVAERETEIIEKRTADLDVRIRSSYEAFLEYMICLSRRYQYGFLQKMQDDVLARLMQEAGLEESAEHSSVCVRFCSRVENNSLNMYLNMITLNGIKVKELMMTETGDRQRITMILKGNIKNTGMRCLLCQLGKEVSDFKILSLEK